MWSDDGRRRRIITTAAATGFSVAGGTQIGILCVERVLTGGGIQAGTTTTTTTDVSSAAALGAPDFGILPSTTGARSPGRTTIRGYQTSAAFGRA